MRENGDSCLFCAYFSPLLVFLLTHNHKGSPAHYCCLMHSRRKREHSLCTILAGGESLALCCVAHGVFHFLGRCLRIGRAFLWLTDDAGMEDYLCCFTSPIDDLWYDFRFCFASVCCCEITCARCSYVFKSFGLGPLSCRPYQSP